MKAIFTLFIPVPMMLGNVSQATTYNVTNAGFTFSPATLTINIGDEVNFDLGVDHNAVEVSKATWDVNGFTSNGGFATPLGGGQVTFLQPGTYYYVCVPHASLSMKGTIVVNTITGINNPSNDFFTSCNLPGF
jgi:plastocyanin